MKEWRNEWGGIRGEEGDVEGWGTERVIGGRREVEGWK